MLKTFKRLTFLLVFVSFIFIGFGSKLHAQDAGFSIIPEKDNATGDDGKDTATRAVENVGTGESDIWTRYNQQAADEEMTLGDQFASGIMNWDTILRYAVYLVRSLFQLALIGGVGSIMWAGYIYATGVFTGNATQGHKAIKAAIIGVAVVVFSFTIIQVISNFFYA